MPILPRRPVLIAVMCFYVIVSLVIVLVVLSASDSDEKNTYDVTMSTLTRCRVLISTMSRDENDRGLCRYRVDVQYEPYGRPLKNAVAYSGLVGGNYGDCEAARVFSDRFSRVQDSVPCYYNADALDQVRLWSSNEAGSAVPTPDGDDATVAITVVVVLLAVIVVLLLLYSAQRCGVFGEDGIQLRSQSYRALPKEPGTGPGLGQSTTTLSQPLSISVMASRPPVPVPVVPPHQPAHKPMVKIGLAQAPQHMVDDAYSPPDPLSVHDLSPAQQTQQAAFNDPLMQPTLQPTLPPMLPVQSHASPMYNSDPAPVFSSPQY